MGASCTKAGREEAAFLKSAKDGDCHAVQQAIIRDVEWGYKVQTWNGQSVFHLAARYGRLDVLETVVEAVRFNPAGPEKWRRLLRMGHSTDAILRSFANLQDARCQTPLHLACIYGHADLAERLLQLGGTPWSWDELGGRTPLHYAASMGHVDVIRVVVSHNALAPAGEALRRPNSSRTRLVDICNDSGYTPLHYAVWAGNTAAIRALTSYDASLSARNVACGSDWVVSCLKCTPLHLAAHKGNEAVVKLLLSAYVQSQPPQGADAPPITDRRRRDPRRHVNANRQLPYHVAVGRNHTRLAEMLHPDVPFSFILTPAEMESRMYGVAKLAVMAARTLQAKLISDIELAVGAIAASLARGACGGVGAASMSRTRSAALSGAVVAIAAGQAGGGAVMAQQVLAAATARLRSFTSIGQVTDAPTPSDTGAPQSPRATANGPRNSFQASQPQQQALDPARVVPGRPSHDSITATTAATTTPPAVVGTAATAPPAAAAPAKEAGPPSGGSSATSDDSGKEPLAADPVPDLTPATRAPNLAVPSQLQPEPLPLPPAPISPFLPPPASSAGAGAAAAAGGPRPPTFNDAASAFALFAAEPFDEPAGAGGGQPPQPLGSTSVSLAVVTRNRLAVDAAATTTTAPPVASTSISIAALARGIIPGVGNASGNKLAPSRSRSLRSLLTGGRQRRTTSQHQPQPQRGEPAGDVSGGEGDYADDLDAILYAMRPGDEASGIGATPAAVASVAATLPATLPDGAAGGEEGPASAAGASATSAPRAATAASAAPTSALQQSSQPASPRAVAQQQHRLRGGPLNFWRRTTSQGPNAQALQQGTPEGGSPCAGSLHGSVQAEGALPITLAASGRSTRASPASRLPSGAAEVLPPGVVEAMFSVDAPEATQADVSANGLAPAASIGALEDATVVAARPLQTTLVSAASLDSTGNDDGGICSHHSQATGATGLELSRLRRSSISLAVVARNGVEDPASGAEGSLGAAGRDDCEDQPTVDGAVLAMLASLVEAPQHVLRRYRLLQLTHGLDLHDMLRDHAELAAGGGAATVGASVGTLGSGRCPADAMSRARSNASELPDWSAHAAITVPPGDAGAVSPLRGCSEAGATFQRQQSSPQSDVAVGRCSLDRARGTNGTRNGDVSGSGVANGTEGSHAGAGSGLVAAAGAGSGAAADSGVMGLGVQAGGAGGGSTAAQANLAGQLLRTISSQAASESGEGMCGVCFDQPDYLRITGCGHRLCADCSRELCKLNAFKPALCPFCRGVIGGFKYVSR